MLKALIERRLARIKYWLRSARYAPYRKDLEGIERYCMFIGYPRSGHSLVGSLLDAHPDIIIAHELDALRYVELGLTRDQIYSLILERSRQFTESGRVWSEYQYAVPNQSNGKYRELKVIGDKKGGITSLKLNENPMLLSRL